MDKFEQAAWDVDKNINSEHENAIEWLKGSSTATITFSQGRYISKIRKLAKEHPEDIQIVAENKDSSIVAHVPVKYIRLQFPGVGREYSEEEKEELRERFKKARDNR